MSKHSAHKLPQLPQLPPLDLDDSSLAAVLRPSTLSPPLPLRKSISVDSFVTAPAVAPPRHHPTPTTRSFVAGLASAFRRDSSANVQRARDRGASVSSVHQDAPDREQRFRLPSLKTDHTRPSIRAGELPLPARTSPPAPQVPQPQPQPTTRRPQQNMSSARSRSASIGAHAQGRRVAVNTHIPPPPMPAPSMDESVTLVVIGAVGCGKSQAIRKGLSGYNLSDSLPSTVQRVVGNTARPSYTYRLGTIVRERSADCPLNVIEIDVPPTDSPIPRDHLWPEAVPCIDAAVVCYDSSDHASFKPVEMLLRSYQAMRLPIIVLACKADMDVQLEPESISRLLQPFRAGLVEVSVQNDAGKDKIRRSFDWLLKAVFRHRKAIDTITQTETIYLNPASPDVLNPSPVWEGSRTATPTVMHSLPPPPVPVSTHQHAQYVKQGNPVTTTSAFPSAAPLVQNHDQEEYEENLARLRSAGEAMMVIGGDDEAVDAQDPLQVILTSDIEGDQSEQDNGQEVTKVEGKLKPAQYATVEQLLDKLLFIAVSGDDQSFIFSFLLTHRRFCTPRSLLLAMQKKKRRLDEPCGDPMFSCFGQMRICHLLEIWIAEYPSDFAVRGAAGALHALIRSIISRTHLLHYGSQLLPFLEVLPTLRDMDSAWAVQPETEDSDKESLGDDETELEIQPRLNRSRAPSPITAGSTSSYPPPPPTLVPAKNSRERKSSLPLVKTLGFSLNGNSGQSDPTPKQQLKDLLRVANEVLNMDATEIAEEITRVEVKYFLDITSRDWMHFVFLKNRKPDDPIVAFNTIANHLAEWVVSLILCHDRPAKRARQMEKMVEIAGKLRAMNNYSALRAFIAGINNATYPGDETIELFRARSPEHAKNLQSWDVLLQSYRAHRAYRLALRNSKGACIPAMEIHIADMLKAQEANMDRKEDNPSLIHWAKFSMMGRFVAVTKQCQNQCRTSTDYNFPLRNYVRDLLVKRPVMSSEMQRSRLDDPEFTDYGASTQSELPKQDAQVMRRLFFW